MVKTNNVPVLIGLGFVFHVRGDVVVYLFLFSVSFDLLLGLRWC